MKWKSVRRKQKELRIYGLQSLSPLNQNFSIKAVSELELAVHGTIVRPTDPDYHRDRQLANYAFQDFPQLIVYCEVFSDVRACLKFARAHDLPIVVRSGGHSTAGFSINSGIVIDLSRLNYVVVDAVKKQAIVGAGTKFGHLNAALDIYNLHVPGGGCHDVCVAGFMQGGGYGYTSRQFGMNCDNVIEASVMLADGGIVVASQKKNPDLFWALRGGTGGNFGVLLQITYQLHELKDLWGFRIWWSLDSADGMARAASILAKLQSDYMATGAPKELGYMAFLVWQENERCLLMRGMYSGSPEDGKRVLAPLLETKPDKMLDHVGSYREIDEFIHQTPEVPQVPDLAREDKQSGYIKEKLQRDDWLKVIEAFLKTPNTWSMLAIEPYGGAINVMPVDANAFIHRDVDMDLYVDVFWMREDERNDAVKFLDEFMDFMEQNYFNGQSYQNYPRLSQTDYRQRYWGQSFATLLAVKRKYDPDPFFFRYPQGVLPDDGEAIIAEVRAWIETPIKYEMRNAD